MITLMILPNFRGTAKETLIAFFVSVCLDCAYLIPILF